MNKNKQNSAAKEQDDGKSTLSINPGEFLIWLYREPLDHLSAVRRPSCPMYPSCSEYGRICFKKKGFFWGWIMAYDRLMRCGRDEMETAPKIMVNGEMKFFDPPPFLKNEELIKMLGKKKPVTVATPEDYPK